MPEGPYNIGEPSGAIWATLGASGVTVRRYKKTGFFKENPGILQLLYFQLRGRTHVGARTDLGALFDETGKILFA